MQKSTKSEEMSSQNYHHEQVTFLDLFEKVAAGLDPKSYVPTSKLEKTKVYKVMCFIMVETKYGRSLAVELYGVGRIILPSRVGDLIKTANEEAYIEFLNAMHYKMEYLGTESHAEKTNRMPKHLFKFVSTLSNAEQEENFSQLDDAQQSQHRSSETFGKWKYFILRLKINTISTKFLFVIANVEPIDTQDSVASFDKWALEYETQKGVNDFSMPINEEVSAEMVKKIPKVDSLIIRGRRRR